MSATEVIKNKIKTGEETEASGYYKYLEHVTEANNEDCFIPPQTKMMLFKKGEKAPTLGSCPHDVVWKLLITV